MRNSAPFLQSQNSGNSNALVRESKDSLSQSDDRDSPNSTSLDCPLNQQNIIEFFLHRTAVFTLIAIFLSSFVAFGDEKQTIRTQVETLIRELDSRRLAERSRAERALLELGPDVLQFLPAPETIDSQSAREAIRRIRPNLERRAARESSIPSKITINGDHTLVDAIETIHSQTRNYVALADDAREYSDKRILFDLNQKHFWDSIDELCAHHGLEWRYNFGSTGIMLHKATNLTEKEIVVQRVGPFRLVIRTVEVRPIVGDDAQRILRVNGRLAIEPRLRPLFLSIAAKDLTAVVDEDRVLSTWNPGAKYEFPVNDGGRDVPVQWDFHLPLEVPVTKVSIHGRMNCQIAAATERIVFDQTSQTRGKTRRRGGVTVRLRNVEFETAENQSINAEIGVTVSYDAGGPAFESHRSWIFHNAAYFEDKAGARLDFTDFETSQQGDGAISVDYRWKQIATPANPYLFVYEAPTLIIDVPIEIDLAEIPVTQ